MLDTQRNLDVAEEKDMIKMANDAVEKLTEISPNMGWDCGDSTAQYYYRKIDEALTPQKNKPRIETHHTPPISI